MFTGEIKISCLPLRTIYNFKKQMVEIHKIKTIIEDIYVIGLIE